MQSRVGCMGISGGGTVTVFATALDPRIRAALVSGYLNTFRDSIGSLAHCIDNYVPGILNWAEMHDLAGLIAPRPLFVESGEKDNIFPIRASIESFNEVRRIYSVFDAADRVEQEVFPAEHLFWGRRGIPFLCAPPERLTSLRQLRARRRVGLEIAEHELDASEHHLHEVRHHVELRPVPEHAVEHAPLALALDPHHAEIVVRYAGTAISCRSVLSASTLSSTCSFSRVYGPVIGK